MSDKDFRRFDPIVPERDGPAPKASAPSFTADDNVEKPGNRSGKGAPPQKSSPTTASGSQWPLLLCLVALVAIGAFSWYQSRVLEDLNTRFSQLSARIESTDESLNESGTTLSLKIKEQGEKLDEHWGEIRKLWGVSYDTNRKAIAENTKSIEQQKTSIANIQASLKKTESSLAGFQQSIDAVKKQAEAADQSVSTMRSSSLGISAQLDELNEQVEAMSGRVSRTDSTVKQINADLTRRIAENEKSLRALDTYRAQVNQQLSQLRQQVGGP